MEFAEWEPVYEAILADFGYDRTGDEAARDLLDALCGTATGEPLDPDSLSFDGESVAIVGAAPSLADEVADGKALAAADRVVAASSAADVLVAAGVRVDLLVTDLDGNPLTAVELTHEGTPVAVHAHGDNRPALREWVPQMAVEAVLPTTQAEPVGVVHDLGGFTDGDRAAFIADHLDAAELVFAGWEFDDPDVTPVKHRKLEWAERLLYWLEVRRGERFSVLDGRRDGIDASGLPI